MSEREPASDEVVVGLLSMAIGLYSILGIIACYQFFRLPSSFNDHPIRKHRRAFYIAALLLCVARVTWCILSMTAVGLMYVPSPSGLDAHAPGPAARRCPRPSHATLPRPASPRRPVLTRSAFPTPPRRTHILNRLSFGLLLTCFSSVLFTWVYFLNLDHRDFFVRNQGYLTAVKIFLFAFNLLLYLATVVSALVYYYYDPKYSRKEMLFFGTSTFVIASLLLVAGLRVYCLTRQAQASRTCRLLTFVFLLCLLMMLRFIMLIYHQATGEYLPDAVFAVFSYFVPEVVAVGVQMYLYGTTGESQAPKAADQPNGQEWVLDNMQADAPPGDANYHNLADASDSMPMARDDAQAFKPQLAPGAEYDPHSFYAAVDPTTYFVNGQPAAGMMVARGPSYSVNQQYGGQQQPFMPQGVTPELASDAQINSRLYSAGIAPPNFSQPQAAGGAAAAAGFTRAAGVPVLGPASDDDPAAFRRDSGRFGSKAGSRGSVGDDDADSLRGASLPRNDFSVREASGFPRNT